MEPESAFKQKFPRQTLHVGGFVPLSATDFPDVLAATVFCQGCPWRCAYCHNPHLLPAGGNDCIRWDDILDFLHRRQGLLDAVVFSGGEPTLQPALPSALREVRSLGYRIGLHTAGMFPSRLKPLLSLVDWVGMDIKAPFTDYGRITGVPGSGEKALASARLILDSGVHYEFRTTVHPKVLDGNDVLRLACALRGLGAKTYALQAFRAVGCTHPSLRALPDSGYLAEIVRALDGLFDHFSVRAD